MGGNRVGGKYAAKTNISRYGRNFYKVIGSQGGKLGTTGGFAAGEEGRRRAEVYGRLGGSISRIGVKLTPVQKARKRREFEKTYKHLLKVHKEANT